MPAERDGMVAMQEPWRLDGFTELRELGAGAQGRVVLARPDDGSGGPVAIKYLVRRDGDTEAIERLREEAAMLARVTDAHVVRLHRFVTDPRGAALVMEAVDGVSLKRLLAENGHLEPEAALAVLKGSLLGLAAAHDVGIVHRDYKPGNVVVRGDGLSKLIDFGIAVLSGEGARSGTPAYMAPEQWRGEPATPATDVYAATCVFFECVTGRRPFGVEDGLGALREGHLSGDPPLETVPGALHELVRRGMAKNAIDRPVGAADLVADLETAATAAYGPDWEQRGLRALAVAAAALAALFPLAAAAFVPGAAVATTAGAGSTAAGGAVTGGLLGAVGVKVALAVSTAAVVAAGGGAALYVTDDRDERPPGPVVRPVAAVAALNQSTPLPGLPTLQIQNAQFVRVSGLGDTALQQRVNTALRAPLDRLITRFRIYVTGEHPPVPGPPQCAEVRSRADLRYSGPRMVSVVYTFGTRSCTVADEDPAGAEAVTVDLRTGRALSANDIFRDTSSTGISALDGRLGEAPATTQAECLEPIEPADLRPGPNGLRPQVQFTFTGARLELRMLGVSLICSVGYVRTAPYADIVSLIKPEVAALLPTASPTPERT